MTQTERVLAMLRDAGGRGVCSASFYEAHLPHARNRIAVELRDRGFVVSRGPCTEHEHATGYFRYRLTHDPEMAPQQMRLVV